MAFNSCSEEHGGINPAELKQLGILPADLIDFSVNSNPFGPSPSVLEAIRTVDISTYPDRKSTALHEILAQANQVPAEHILVGNGTAELIWLAAHAFLKPGDKVLIAGPTFGEYQRAASTKGAQVTEIRAQPPLFLPPLEQMLLNIKQEHPRLVFLCNPNNPTGIFLNSDVVRKLSMACGSKTILIIDEAYKAFVDGQTYTEVPGDNCLILRSMTKDFALAGIRLGYIMGNPALIEQIQRYQPAWSVNSLAQAAGIAAIMDRNYYQKNFSDLVRLKEHFFSQILITGYSMVPSDVHFGLIQVDYPAKQLRLQLLKSCIQVRDCTSFGLPEHIRISTRKEADNMKLIEALNILHKNNPPARQHKEELR
jgi:histidinol-phosphate aminotransferase